MARQLKALIPVFVLTVLGSVSAAWATEPNVRIALSDKPVAAPARRAAPAVRVAALVDTIAASSEARSAAVPVFRAEADYITEHTNLPHHGHWFSNRYGFQPGCCDNVGFTDGLWAGYCETRRSHWMHGTYFQRRFYGGDCCEECETGKPKAHTAKYRR